MYQVRHATTRWLLLCLFVGLAVAVDAQSNEKEKIEKCQDRDGRWHYGNFAARACTKGKVTILTPQGVVVDQKESPDVMMELSDQERFAVIAAQRKKEALEKRAKEDQAYLNRYSSVAAVVAERDRKLAERDAAIDTAQKVQADLNRDIQILRKRQPSDENLIAITEREDSVQAYQREVLRYRVEQQTIWAEYAEKAVRYQAALSRLNQPEQK